MLGLFLLMTSTAYAYPDAIWLDHSSHELVAGHKGAIISVGQGNLDAAQLGAARSKSLTIQWILANDVDPAATPEEIGRQLAGKVNFFVITTYKLMPEVHERFSGVRQSYTNREWTDVTYKENQMAMPKSRRQWTEDEWSHTEYVDIPASTFDTVPVYVVRRIYDMSGKLIAAHGHRLESESFERTFADSAGGFFGGVMNNLMNNSNDPYKRIDVSANEWTAPGYSLHNKASIYLAPVTVAAADIADFPAYALAFENAAMLQAANRLHGVMVTHNEYAPLRMEIDVANFDNTYERAEAHYRLEDETRTDYTDIAHDDDCFSDTLEETRHWTECTTYPGTCYLKTHVTLSIKLYDRDTNQLVYSYIGNTVEGETMDDLYSILEDFYGKLGNKIG